MNIGILTELFPYEKFAVERECWKRLQDASELSYLGIPWTQILNSSWLKFPGRKSPDYYTKLLMGMNIPQENNFTVCQHDNYYELYECFKHLSIKKIFCPAIDATKNLDGIEVIPIAYTNNFNFKSQAKNVLFSFIGSGSTHRIRKHAREAIKGPNVIFRDNFHIDVDDYSGSKKSSQEEEFQDIMERSRYTLCPRGNAPSAIRFWEALAAGSIPILISDHWILPEWNWDNTILRISESDFVKHNYESIETLIKTYSSKEDEMRKNCTAAYKKFGMENYVNYILSKVK